MSTTLEALHDRLLEEMPEGASHDASDCTFCTPSKETASATRNGGAAVSDKTYTEDEHNAVLAKVTDLEAKVIELTTATEASTFDAKVAEAKAELEAQVAELQSQLDTAVLEAQAAKATHDAVVAWLEGEATAAAEAITLAARKDERIAAVKEAASFPDEYLDANADRFVAMSDEAFAAAVEDWKAASVASTTEPKKDLVPNATAMTAARTTDESSPLADVLSLRFMGVDARTVN